MDEPVSDETCPLCGAEAVDSGSGGTTVYTSFACGNTREYNMGSVAYTGDCENG